MVAWSASGFESQASVKGSSILKVHLTIDRFEGRKKEIAVLLTDDGTQINFPKRLLPKGVKAGDILSFEIERDLVATRQVSEQTRQIQEELKHRDPGGDLKL
jgi:hypothetical protein